VCHALRPRGGLLQMKGRVNWGQIPIVFAVKPTFFLQGRQVLGLGLSTL
jgi:hypothetical protein